MNKNLLYTHYNREKFLANFKHELKFVLPAQELKSLTTFNQHIVKAGLNYNDFCEKFNKLTENLPTGVLVPISLFYTPKEKNFEICLRPFQLKYILQQYITLRGVEEQDKDIQKKYQITALNLYKSLLIKGFIINEKNLKKYLRSIFGTLKSYESPMEIFFSIQDFQKMLDKKIITEHQINALSCYLDEKNLEKLKIQEGEEAEEIDVVTFLKETNGSKEIRNIK